MIAALCAAVMWGGYWYFSLPVVHKTVDTNETVRVDRYENDQSGAVLVGEEAREWEEKNCPPCLEIKVGPAHLYN